MPIRGARIYQWRRECWTFLDHRTTSLLNWEEKLKSNSENTIHFSSNQTGSPVQPATPSFDFLSFLGRLPWCPGPTGSHSFSTCCSFSTCHIEPAHSTLSQHRA